MTFSNYYIKITVNFQTEKNKNTPQWNAFKF